MLKSIFALVLYCFALRVECQSSNPVNGNCPPTSIYYNYAPEDVRDIRQPVSEGNIHQGLPGKSGVKGEQGLKGDKGSKGEKGQSDDTANQLQQVKEQLDQLKLAYDQLQENFTQQASQLEHISNALHRPSSCNDVRGEDRVSGNYDITPVIGQNPFTVYCNFTGEAVETIIEQDSLNEKQASHGCQPARCSKNPIRYNLQLSQIIAVIDQSSSCKQFVKYRCIHTQFLDQVYAAWLDRNRDPQLYWGGATSEREGYCACGETGTCENARAKCNCSKNSGPETSDEGYLTDKEKLPVTELQFGDLDDSNEYGYYTVGPLICTGDSG